MTFGIRISVIAVLAMLAAPLRAQETKEDPLAVVSMLAGHWVGVGEGEPGLSAAVRHAEHAHGGRYLRIEGRSVYPKQDKNKRGEVHTQTDYWSYDRGRKLLKLRQFDNLGFISTYVEDKAASRPGHLVLVSEQLENVPTGWKARYTYEFVSADEYRERFELDGGKGLQLYTFNRFLRVQTPQPENQ